MRTTPTNQLFHFSRWQLLVGKHWVEHRRRYLLSLLAIGGLLAVYFGFFIVMDAYVPMDLFTQYAGYFVGLYFTGSLYASILFADLGTKKEALPWLSLPASHFEKLLCALLFGTVFFYLAYNLVFYLVDIPMVQWADNIIRSHPRNFPYSNQQIPPVSLFNILTAEGSPQPERDYRIFTLGFFAIQSAFLLGSVYFRSYAFIKTVVAVILFIVAFIVFERGIIYPLLPKSWDNNVFHWTERPYNDEPPQNEVRLTPVLERTIIIITLYGLTPFFWFITYHRLKEKEV